MNRKNFLVLVSSIVWISFLTNCALATRFAWGDYENSLYVYYKSPSERASYKKALLKAIETGRKNNNVAPGLLAELGYLELEDGNQAQADNLFQEEMMRFPESRGFLKQIMDRGSSEKNESTGATS